jgi:hypothetical protein
MIMGMFDLGITQECRNSVVMIVLTTVGFINLIAICKPFTKWRTGVCILVGVGLLVTATFSLALSSIIPGTVDILGEDPLGILPAFENKTFFFGTLGVGVSLAVLLQLVRGKLERFIFSLIDKLAALKKS